MILEDDTKLFVNHRNQDSDKPCMVFIHGDGQNHTVWKMFEDYFFDKGHSVLSYDLAGQGLSEPYKDGKYSYSKFTDTLKSVLQECKIDKPILVGNSSGGMISLQYATGYPDNLTSVVAMGSTDQNPTKYNPDTPKIAEKFVEMAKEQFQGKKLLRYELPIKDEQNPHEGALKYTPPEVIKDYFEAMMKYDISSKLGEIKVPVLIITGDNDSFITEECLENMKRGIPKSKVVIIEDCDHHVLLRKPDEVLEGIKENYHFLLQK